MRKTETTNYELQIALSLSLSLCVFKTFLFAKRKNVVDKYGMPQLENELLKLYWGEPIEHLSNLKK